MKRASGLLIVFLILAAAVIWTSGCRDDVVVPFPPTLIGDYTGVYRYVEIHNGVDTMVDTTQLILFRFSTDNYQMTMDPAIPEEVRVFCDPEGEYTIENGVNLTETDPNRTRGVCTLEWNPYGGFGLDQTNPDTVRISQSEVDSVGVRRSKLLMLAPQLVAD